MDLCCLREFTEVTKGAKGEQKVNNGNGGQTQVRNSFEALAEEESVPPPPADSDEEGNGHEKRKKSGIMRRWSGNASH